MKKKGSRDQDLNQRNLLLAEGQQLCHKNDEI